MPILNVAEYPLYAKACRIAEEAHKGQMYGDSDKPYMYHLLNVANIVAERNHGKVSNEHLDKLLAVAMLHDTLEDTDLRFEELQSKYLMTLDVTVAVIQITRYEDEEYADYIKGFSKDALACEVKICDTATNLEHSVRAGSQKRIEKYSKQLRKLNKIQAKHHAGQ